MPTPEQTQVTALLGRIREGDDDARSRLFRLVYDELRAQAARNMAREQAGHTLQTTALVHEAFVKLWAGPALENAPNRGYFFGAAAQAMRQVLVDHARARGSKKRGGDVERVPLDEVLDATARAMTPRALGDDPAEAVAAVLSLDASLDKLAAMNARQHQVVMLRFFGGLTMPQVADALQVSLATVEADFRLAKAWLRSELG